MQSWIKARPQHFHRGITCLADKRREIYHPIYFALLRDAAQHYHRVLRMRRLV